MASKAKAILSLRIVSDADSKGFKKAVREIKAFEKKVNRSNSSLSKLGDGFRAMGRKAAQFGVTAATMATKAAAMTTAIGGVAAPLAALGTAAAGVVGPMAALGAAMAPAALGSAALAMGVLKSATAGFGDALSASDPAAFAEAIANMPPAAQEAVTALKGLKDSFSDIGNEVQQSFWAEVSNIGDLAVLLEPIRGAMNGLAMDMGNATAGLVAFVTQGTGLSAMQQIIQYSSIAAAHLSYAFADVLKGIIAVGAAAAPIFAQITAKMEEMAAGWAQSMTGAFQDGSLQAFFADAVAKAQQLFAVLGQLGTIVGAVFTAMSNAGAPFLGTLGQIITAVEKFVTSAQGMQTLESIFSALTAAVAAVLPIVGQLAGLIGGTLAPVFAQLVTTIAPVIGQIVTALSGVITAISPLLPIVGQLAAMVGGVLAQAITAVTPIFQQLAEILGTALTQAMQMLAPIFPIIVQAFQQLAVGLQPLMPAIQALVQAFIGLIPPIVQLASGLIPGLVQIVLALVPVFVAVVEGVTNFVNSLQPLISVVAALAGPVLGALANILGVVAGAIAPVIRFVVELALQIWAGTKAVNAIKGAFGAVRGAISAAGDAFNAIKGAISGVVAMVSALIGKLASIHWPSPPAWLSKVFGEDATMIGGGVVTGTYRPVTTSLQAARGDAASFARAANVAARGATMGGVNITINGAVNPRETAEQIRKILRADARTRGLATAGGYGLWQST